MEAATRRFNELLAAKIGIEQIEALHHADIVSRKLLGLISHRQKLAVNPKDLNDYNSIHFNLECIYIEINSLINRLCPKILEEHSRRINAIMADLLANKDLQESKRTIARDIFPGIPKNVILEIIRNRNIPQRIMQKMSRTRMNPSAVAQFVAIQKDPLIRSSMVTQYFKAMRNNAYMIARTAISSMMGQIARNTYSALPKELVGFQIHAILDSRTRPAHRERDKTVYYKNPRYGNLGFDQMPNPPLEADGSTAFNCRCVTGDCRINGYVKSISRFLYDGEFTKIRTASGAEITVTSNHPIATNIGLVSANMIDKGDNLITDFSNVGNFSTNVKNKVPTIKDVFESILVNGGRFSSLDSPNSLDFHGDGEFIKSKIDIIFADRKLMDESDASPVRLVNENGLVMAETVAMSVPDLIPTNIVSHSRPLDFFRNRLASRLDSGFDKPSPKAKSLALVGSSLSNASPTDPILLRECVQGFTSDISGNKVSRWFFELGESSRFRFSPQFDPKAGDPSSDSFAFNSEFSSYLLERFTRNISLDKVIEVTRFHKKDLVYSVDSHNGYYMASDNNIAIVNGNCWLTPILNIEPTKFYDFKGRIIPDAKTFSQWFGSSAKDKQVLAIGIKRHQMASSRLKKGETLQWWHLLHPDSGMLLDLDEIKSESPQKRAGRIKKAKNIIFKP